MDGDQPRGTQAAEPSVADVPQRHRYEIRVGGELAGNTAYLDQGGQRIFYHTEIGPRFAGRGLGGRLVAAALAGTRAAGRRVVAVCPFAASYLDDHHDFDDIRDRVTPAALAAVRATAGG